VLYRGFCAIGGRDKENKKQKHSRKCKERIKESVKGNSKATQSQKKKIEEHKSQK
jgi:hypothetical protein